MSHKGDIIQVGRFISPMTHVISNIRVHVSYHTWTLDQEDLYRGLYTVCENINVHAQLKMYGLIIIIIILCM